MYKFLRFNHQSSLRVNAITIHGVFRRQLSQTTVLQVGRSRKGKEESFETKQNMEQYVEPLKSIPVAEDVSTSESFFPPSRRSQRREALNMEKKPKKIPVPLSWLGTDSDWEEPNDTEQSFQRSTPEGEFGKNRIGAVVIPRELSNAIDEVLHDKDKQLLRVDAIRIFDSLRSTSAATRKDTPKREGVKCAKSYKEEEDSSKPKAVEIPEVQPYYLEYGMRETWGYLAARMPSTYASISFVFRELSKRLPNFQPTNALDFGTGPGTAIWAANEYFGKSIQRYHGVDISDSMLTAAETLIEKSSISNVTFERYFSYNPNQAKSDLVVSAFSLSELPNDGIRQSTLEALWNKTSDVLVLIERGTPEGFRIISSARQHLLSRANKVHDSEALQSADPQQSQTHGAHVVAPCPHDGECPMIGSSMWCHYSQRLQRPRVLMKTKHAKTNVEDTHFSYVVLRRGSRPTSQNTSPKDITKDAYQWPRLIRAPLKRGGHVVMDLCSSSNFIERMIIPKSQGKLEYRDARKASWGDIFPHSSKKPAQRKPTSIE
ncbi:37S ribosomal protein S22 [Basidiobolus ranarum]|uniref:37S ribosomal protein S22 n=1 Tax=Basidiobolus ranarum TaxID=34480 RepID=A0ABR2W9S6_9FUNG